jgi:hypothetical protein
MNDLRRRAFLTSGSASVALVAGGRFAFAGHATTEEQLQIPESVAGRLASQLPPFDGAFVFDQLVCRAMATDYGHYVHHMPLGVLFPPTQL